MSTSPTLVRCISSQEEYDNAQKRLLELGRNIHQTESERLEFHALAVLCEDWENENILPIADYDAVEYILFIMEARGLKNKDMVSYFGNPSRVSEVLNRKRALSLNMIRALHDGLGIPLEILVKELKKNTKALA